MYRLWACTTNKEHTQILSPRVLLRFSETKGINIVHNRYLDDAFGAEPYNKSVQVEIIEL